MITSVIGDLADKYLGPGWGDIINGTLGFLALGLGVVGSKRAAARVQAAERSAMRENVLRNIEESRRARESSNFDIHTKRNTANQFYKDAGWEQPRIDQHITGIDFTKPVDVISIGQGTEAVQYQVPGRPVGNYFAPPGTEASQLGINPAGREPITFAANKDVQVLRSTALPVVDTWSTPGQPYQTQGGGTQYFVPDPGAFTPK